MPRATSVLLLVGGAALLVTWLVSPAASSPGPRRTSAAMSGALLPANTDLDNAVARLRAREAMPAGAYRAPVRNPFAFAASADRAAGRSNSPAAAVAAARSPRPLPRLTAILSTPVNGSGSPTPDTAVFADTDGDGVTFVRAGGTMSGFVVKSIGSSAVVLVDPSSASTFTVALQ